VTRSRWIVVGAGRRVRADVLPVLAALRDEVELAGPYSRRAHPVEAVGRTYETAPLSSLGAADVAAADVVCVCVAKPAVPAVLRHLEACEPAAATLLVDTPVVLFRHLAAFSRFSAFGSVSVPEDCSTLPWIPLARRALGTITSVRFERSAYRYHAFALAKALLGARDVVRARRRRLGADTELTIELEGGGTAVVVEPRDYARGRLVLTGTRGTLCDAPGRADLKLVLAGDDRGAVLRAGEHERRLDATESALLGPLAPGDTVTSRMEDLKRVGLLALAREVLAGRPAYPLLDALEDASVDALCDKLGRYRRNPVISVKSRLGRAMLGTVLRAAGGRG